MKFNGHPGNDNFTGTDHADTFELANGGNDSAKGLGGNDVFNMGAALNAKDSINGGDGNDTVNLNGDYANLVLHGSTLTNVETLVLAKGHDYSIATADKTVGSSLTLTVKAAALKVRHHCRTRE